MFTLQADTPDFRAALKAVELDSTAKLEMLLQQVGIEVVTFLRSLTAEMRPPANPGEGQRQAHPGGWADVTGNLANAYSYQVDAVPGGFQITFRNTMEYAVYLEARNGYFVLSGVLQPGGPVDGAIRRAVAHVFPGWRVE